MTDASSLVVRNARLRDFRTYEALDLTIDPGLVAFVGPNGVGKTNLLEAIAWGTSAATPRTSAEQRVIRHGASVTRVELSVELSGSPHALAVALGRNEGKRIEFDHTQIGVDDLATRIPTVVFLPERLLVVRGAPARRRAMLDRLAVRLDPAAARPLAAYSKAMSQRNALLRRGKAGADVRAALTPWTQQVVEQGALVRAYRDAALAALAEPFRARFDQLTGFPGGHVELDLRGADLAAALTHHLDLDLRRGTTSAGPHLDDLRLLEADRDLSTFGSTGEQRASLLAWALAEADALTQARGIVPTLLLDEPYAELDPGRRALLSKVLADWPQAIVTVTERDLLGPLGSAAQTQLRTVSFGAVR